MERILLILGGALTLLLLLYVTVVQDAERPADLSSLSAIHPDDAWYQETVLESKVPVLVEFTADWCTYCKQLAVVLKDIEKEYGDRIKIVQVDVEKHQEIASAYNVTGLPLMLVIKDKKVVAYAPGMMRYETVENLIKPHLAGTVPQSNKTEDSPNSVPESEATTYLLSSSAAN